MGDPSSSTRKKAFVTTVRRSAQDHWLVELQMWAVSCGASTWLIDLEPYESCRVAGIVDRLRIDPAEQVIEVTITDGTASAVARWSTRRTSRLPVIPGAGVLLEGFAAIGPDGRVVLSEPLSEPAVFPHPESLT